DAVSEKDDSFAAPDLFELSHGHQINGVIEAGAASGFQSVNGQCHQSSIRSRIAEDSDVLVENYDHHPIVFLQLVNELGGGAFYLGQLRFSGIADVQYQGDGKRLFGVFEEGDALLNAVFEQMKLILFQTRDESTVSIHNTDGNSHDGSADLDYIYVLIVSRLLRCGLLSTRGCPGDERDKPKRQY